MKKLLFISLFTIGGLVLSSCSSDFETGLYTTNDSMYSYTFFDNGTVKYEWFPSRNSYQTKTKTGTYEQSGNIISIDVGYSQPHNYEYNSNDETLSLLDENGNKFGTMIFHKF